MRYIHIMPKLTTDISHIAYATHEGIRLKVYKDSFRISRHSLKVKWIQTIQFADSISQIEASQEVIVNEDQKIDSSILGSQGYWSHLLAKKVH